MFVADKDDRLTGTLNNCYFGVSQTRLPAQFLRRYEKQKCSSRQGVTALFIFLCSLN